MKSSLPKKEEINNKLNYNIFIRIYILYSGQMCLKLPSNKYI